MASWTVVFAELEQDLKYASGMKKQIVAYEKDMENESIREHVGKHVGLGISWVKGKLTVWKQTYKISKGTIFFTVKRLILVKLSSNYNGVK